MLVELIFRLLFLQKEILLIKSTHSLLLRKERQTKLNSFPLRIITESEIYSMKSLRHRESQIDPSALADINREMKRLVHTRTRSAIGSFSQHISDKIPFRNFHKGYRK